jgi:cytochrome c
MITLTAQYWGFNNFLLSIITNMKKKIIVATVMAVSFIACNNDTSKDKKNEAATGEKKDATTGEKKEAAPDLSTNPDYQAGLAVIGSSDCLTCHKVDEGIQGPSYRDVANKYADSARETIIPHLAGKIRNGGTGVWGQIPMTPHPGLSQEEAEAAVKYILLLKNK